MEIVFGKINSAAAFSNEGIFVAQAAARLIQLCAGQIGQPDARKLRCIETFKELMEMMENNSAKGKKRVEGDIDGLCAAKGRHGRCESL